jgi:hypothetical protein
MKRSALSSSFHRRTSKTFRATHRAIRSKAIFVCSNSQVTSGQVKLKNTRRRQFSKRCTSHHQVKRCTVRHATIKRRVWEGHWRSRTSSPALLACKQSTWHPKRALRIFFYAQFASLYRCEKDFVDQSVRLYTCKNTSVGHESHFILLSCQHSLFKKSKKRRARSPCHSSKAIPAELFCVYSMNSGWSKRNKTGNSLCGDLVHKMGL